MTLVDANVLLDLATNDVSWLAWSKGALEAASATGEIYINGIVYAEMSVRYESSEQLDDFLHTARIEVTEIPRPALFLAAKVFHQYKKAGGTKANVLPDFFIGSHAFTSNMSLITRDIRRYRTYFPELKLISPSVV